MRLLFYGLVVALLAFQSCAHSRSSEDTQDLIQGDYQVALEKGFKMAQEANNIRSLLVSHHGVLVTEAYFGRYPSDSLDHVRSVTKSVVATLIGIGIDKKFIGSIDDPITTYLGDIPKDKATITVRHLLTMTSGIEWHEDTDVAEYNAWVTSGDQVKYVLNKPMANQPGIAWSYNSAGTHLLSVILTNASGMSTLEFAHKYLFSPIGIEIVKWERLHGGYYNGGAGLQLSPLGMIRFGELYANDGIFNGMRIVSQEFIQQATQSQEPESLATDEKEGYGYCWWVGEPLGIRAYVARGYGGQVIAIFPENELVVSITHHWRVNADQASKQGKKALKIVSAMLLGGVIER